MNAKERAVAIQEWKHYRSMIESKRLNCAEKDRIRDRANALAARYNLTTQRI